MDYSEQLNEVIAALSAEKSLRGLFQQHLAGNPLPSARSINEIVKLSRAIIFPGYFGSSKINRHTVSYHIGVQVEQLFGLLTDHIVLPCASKVLIMSTMPEPQPLLTKILLSQSRMPCLLKKARANFSSEDHSTEINANAPVTSCGEYSSCAMTTAKKDAVKQGGVESVSSIKALAMMFMTWSMSRVFRASSSMKRSKSMLARKLHSTFLI